MAVEQSTANSLVSARPDARYYRFGLCGLTAGGKTCILAALALPRVAHLDGLTATLLPVSKNAAQHLKDGWKWVNDAREALQHERLPEPNPHKGRLTLRYKFTDGRAREAFVELVDYSGELLDSRLSQSELAEQLRRYLGEVNGFLFIAEHPKPGENSGELAGYLLHLKEALAAQREEARGRSSKPSAPIAFLVNKWDRSGPLVRAADTHAEESRRLDAFLKTEPPPPHAGLFAELRAASSGGCHPFPVSAFGEAVREPGEKPGEFVERPARVAPELPSFGLEEPFLWLIGERDRRDVEELAAASRNPELWWNPWTAIHCWRNARRIAARMSAASPEVPRLRHVRRQLSACFAVQFALLLLLWLGVELSTDTIGLRRARAAMANPADGQGWNQAEAWFTRYSEDRPWRHVLHRKIFLSPAAAAAELQSERSKRDEETWAAVATSADEASRGALARDYLNTLPQGTHRSAALLVLEDIKTRQSRDRLRAQLQALTSRLDGIAEEVKQAEKNPEPVFKPAAEKLQQLSRDAQNVSGIEVADDALAKQWQSIVAGVGALDANIAGRVASGELRKTYFALIERNEWEKAGRHLAGLSSTDFTDLRAHFSTNVLPQVDARVRYILGNGAAWREGLAFLEGFQSAQLRPLLPKDAGKQFAALERQINEAGDRWLYEKCTSVGGPGPFADYLAKAPLNSMRVVAEEWLRFFGLRENKNTYRVGVVKIAWGAKAKDSHTLWDRHNRLSIAVGSGKPRVTDFWSDRNSVWMPRPSDHAVEIRDVIAREPQNIELHVWDLGAWWGTPDLGSVKMSSLIEALDGLTRDLTGTDFGPNSASFCVEVLDGGAWKQFTKPPLPPWVSPK